MKQIPIALTIALMTCSAAYAKKGQTIDACNQAATAEIRAGLNFIGGNLKSILKKSGLSDKKTKKVEKKWSKIWVKCIDKKRVCQPTKDGKKVSRAFGRAHGVLSTKIGVCYNAHLRWQEKYNNTHTFCELIDTLFHETGHALNLGTGRVGHKEGDRIFKMGTAAKNVCISAGKNRNIRTK